MKYIETNVKVLTLEGSEIPERLHHIPEAPKTLYHKGKNLEKLLESKTVAIVGSRKVDSYGLHVTKMLASGLAERGMTIISGLALGVDAISHKAAIEAGAETIAVLPCGIDTLYPSINS